MAKHCAQCGVALGERGRFCHRCGAPRDGSAPAAGMPSAQPAAGAAVILPWVVAGIALLALVAFIVGQRFGGRTSSQGANAPSAAAGGPVRAPDISAMSPQERADRLFQRVMTYVSSGQSDSVMFFAPMAIQSFEALAPLDAHQRYDLGLLGLVSSDGVLARAQFAARLSAALVSERAKGLPEYVDHGPDIDAAVREAAERAPVP